MILQLIDAAFHFVHITIIIINMTFWLSFKTLRIAQVTLVLTLVSWVGFGLYYGFGYCFLTDWHWQLKEKIGDTNLPPSYIKLVVDRTFGVNSDPVMVDEVTTIVLVLSLFGCIIQSIREWRLKRR